VEVLLPAVNRSEPDFSIEGEAIRSGLKAIKHLSQATIDGIVRARTRAAFRSLPDFLARVPATRDEVAGMVGCGAFDEIENDRCGALAGYLSLKGNLPRYGQPPLGLADGVCGLPTRRFSPLKERSMEYAALGFSPRVHPLEFFTLPALTDVADGIQPGTKKTTGPSAGRNTVWPSARRRHVRRACQVRPWHAVSAVGLLAAMRHYKANGADIYFLTLDNPQGLTECIVSRTLLSGRLEIGKAYHVTGALTSRFGVETLRVTSIAALPEKLI
jgi:DNA polymerase III alpha subunit